MTKLGSKIILIIAWHLQRDGHTKRLNEILSIYLKHYVASDYKDWIKWLPIAEFSYNTTQSISLKNTSF